MTPRSLGNYKRVRSYLTHAGADPATYERSRSGHFENRRMTMISETIDTQQPRTVVELGAGTGRMCGRLAAAFPEIDFMAVEIDKQLSAYGMETYRRRNLSWSDRLPLDGEAGVVFSIDVIHHLDDRAAVFNDVHEAMTAGAAWLAIEPNIWHPAIWYSQERMRRAGLGEDHYRPWITEPELRRAGFAIESRRYAHLWPASFVKPPSWSISAERSLERFRHLGGSVVYLVYRR